VFVNVSGSVMSGGIWHLTWRPIVASTTLRAVFDSSMTTG